jgi:hypothetical protein
MSGKLLVTALVAVLALIAGVIVLVAAPSPLTPAFEVGATALAASLLALLVSLRSVAGRPRGSAGVWLGAAPIPVAAFWGFVALVQTVSERHWSWKVALVVQALGLGTYALVALGASAAAGAAARSEAAEAAAGEVNARLRAAASRALEVSAGSHHRARVDAVTTRLLTAPRNAFRDPVQAEACESDLERLAMALTHKNDAEVELRNLEAEASTARTTG